MDPLVLAGVAFLLGVLSAGAGALFQAQITEARRAEARRRALVAEVRENLRRLGGPVITQVAAAPIVRVAWDAAREIQLEDQVFDGVAVAYMHGAELERYAAVIL